MKIPSIPSLQEMLEAGFHFGHKKQYTDARGRDYYFGVREKVVIINLEKTRDLLKKALEFIASEAHHGSMFLFVGTKPQVKKMVSEMANKIHMPYVTNRWLGGTLTNFETIEKNLKQLKQMESAINNPETASTQTKKERQVMLQKIERAKYNLGGIASLEALPQILIVIDPTREKAAVKEANAMNIPVVAIMDTNSNPRNIAYPIPANDDSVEAMKILLDLFQETIKAHYIAPKKLENSTLSNVMQKENPSFVKKPQKNKEISNE